MSFDRGLDKEDVAHVYCGIPLSRKGRWDTAVCSSMDTSREGHAEQNTPERKVENRVISLMCGM